MNNGMPSISHIPFSDFKQAFEAEYMTIHSDILLTTMDLYTPKKDNKCYNHSLSFMQASCMGKSHLIDHSAKY